MMHPFKTYLQQRGLSQSWVARRAEEMGAHVSQGHLSDVLLCKCPPSLSLLALLERVSGGKVSASKMARWHVENPAAPKARTKAKGRRAS